MNAYMTGMVHGAFLGMIATALTGAVVHFFLISG